MDESGGCPTEGGDDLNLCGDSEENLRGMIWVLVGCVKGEVWK